MHRWSQHFAALLGRVRLRHVLARFHHHQFNPNQSTNLQQHANQPAHGPAHVQVPVVQDNQVCLTPVFLRSPNADDFCPTIGDH